jgi:charged multivesicular body protein 4
VHVRGLTGAAATQALRRKKMAETELDKLAGTRLQLEMQVNTLESANLNAETMAAMKKGSEALKVIHKGMCVPRTVPADLRSRAAVAGRSSRSSARWRTSPTSARSRSRSGTRSPTPARWASTWTRCAPRAWDARELTRAIPQDELQKELAELEQDELNDRLAGADHVPVHTPAGAVRRPPAAAIEDDEEAELRALRAELES